MALVIPSSVTGAVQPVRRRKQSLPLFLGFLLVVVATSTGLLPTASAGKKKGTVKEDDLDASQEFLDHPLFHAGSRPIATRQLSDLMNDSPFFGKVTFEDMQIILGNVLSCFNDGGLIPRSKKIIHLNAVETETRLHYLSNWLDLTPSSSEVTEVLAETLQDAQQIWYSQHCLQILHPGLFKTRALTEEKQRNQFVFSFLVHRAFVEWLQLEKMGGFPKGYIFFLFGAMNSIESYGPGAWHRYRQKLLNDKDNIKKRFEQIFFSSPRRTTLVNELNRLLRLQWKDLPADKQEIFRDVENQNELQSAAEMQKLWEKQQTGQQHALKEELSKFFKLFASNNHLNVVLDTLKDAAFHFVTEERPADRVSLAATCAVTKDGVLNSLNGWPLKKPDVYVFKYKDMKKQDCLSCRSYQVTEEFYPTSLQKVFKKLTGSSAESLKSVLPRHCFSGDTIHDLNLREKDFYKMSTQEVEATAFGHRKPVKVPSGSIFKSKKMPHISLPQMLSMGASSALLICYLRSFDLVPHTHEEAFQAQTDAGLFMFSYLVGSTIKEFLSKLQQTSFYPKEMTGNWDQLMKLL